MMELADLYILTIGSDDSILSIPAVLRRARQIGRGINSLNSQSARDVLEALDGGATTVQEKIWNV